MEEKRCMVCGLVFKTDALLLDRCMRKRFEPNTLTGMGMCPEHDKLNKDGYIAFVGIDPKKSSSSNKGFMQGEDAHRTGRLMHIRRTVAKKMFNMPTEQLDSPVAFIDDAVIDLILEKNKEIKK